MEQKQQTIQEPKHWYDKNYKFLMFIPLFIVILAIIYLGFFYVQHNDFIYRDVSLSGGTTLTLNGEIDSSALESQLKDKYSDVSFRTLTDLRTGKSLAFIIETSSTSEQIRKDVESILGYKLTDENSSTEFSGPSLSQGFYKQLLIALIISFVLMSLVIFVMFKTFIPSIAVIFATFSDLVMPLALINLLGIKISAAGIAAFLMLIGYSVDNNILLTVRAIKRREGTVNSRLKGAFKTGILMTITALIAVVPAFFIVTGLPESFRQIFLILALGLLSDIPNTWLTNAGIIKWYCEKKGIN